MVEIEDLLKKMTLEGGKIVCTGELNNVAISLARCENRMYVNEDGFGFVLVK